MRSILRRASVIAAALIITGPVLPGTAVASNNRPRVTTTTTTSVPYLCRTPVDGEWVPINGHRRGYQTTAPTWVRAGQPFVVTVDPDAAATNAEYIKVIKDVVVAIELPDNADLLAYWLTGGSGLGEASPTVTVVGQQMIITAPGPIAGGTTYDMPAVHLILRATAAGEVTVAPGGASFDQPGFAFTRQVVGEDVWGPLQCYPDPAEPVVFSTTTAF